jgi:ankyrin repeat protein
MLTIYSHICTDITSRSDSKLDNVVYLMNKLQVIVEGQWSLVDSGDEEAFEALQLRRAAQKVLARASALSELKVAVSDESIRSSSALSNNGEQGNEIDIDLWIDQLINPSRDGQTTAEQIQHNSFESTDVELSQKIAVQMEIGDDEFNPEEDFNLDLMQALTKAGKRHYTNLNPEQAAENLDLALHYAKKLSRSRYMQQDLTEERLILATIYLQKRELDKSEEHLATLIRESGEKNINKHVDEAHLKLARVYYLKKSFEEALQHCQKSLHTRTKLHGKASKEYFEAIQLLVLIYSGKGSHLEADVMMDKLPDDLREETELQLQNSAPIGTLPTSPPLSPQPSQKEQASLKQKSLFRKRPSADKGSKKAPHFVTNGIDSLESNSSSDYSNSVPQHNPSSSQNIEPAELLANNGFIEDFDSAKALSWAIKEGHLRVVHYLLEGYHVPKPKKSRFSMQTSEYNPSAMSIKHAHVDGSTKSKSSSPLILAIENGRVMIAKLLLDRGASTSLKDPIRNISPLRCASETGQAEIVKLLLSKGASVESPTEQDLLKLSSSNTNTKSSKEYRAYGPIHGAASKGHEEIVAALLSAGVAVNARDLHGSTALKHACQRGHAGVARLLIQSGASITAADDAGFSPLIAAAFNGHETIIRILRTASSFSVDQTNNVGQSALMIAAEQGHEGTTKLLLNAGARLEHQDAAGWTALISASNRGHLGTVVFLLGAGANINAQSLLGSTALDRAEYRQDRKLAKVLKDNGAVNGSRRMERSTLTAFTGYTL